VRGGVVREVVEGEECAAWNEAKRLATGRVEWSAAAQYYGLRG
jgi:hypothetical protein